MAEHLPPDPPEAIGIVAVIVMTVFLLLVGVRLLTLWAEDDRGEIEERYLQCVRDIPTYLDGQETLYLEQECRQGVSP